MIPIDKKTPTPNPITNISVLPSITSLACFARTCKSGSAIVIKTPNKKQINTSKNILFFFVKPLPTC